MIGDWSYDMARSESFHAFCLLVFSGGKEYNKRRSFGGSVKSL